LRRSGEERFCRGADDAGADAGVEDGELEDEPREGRLPGKGKGMVSWRRDTLDSFGSGRLSTCEAL
jgi:hypothetical protein